MSKPRCIETTDRERSCNTCKYSSTDGMFTPSYWCNKEEYHGDRGGSIYNSVVAGVGTVCKDWEV